MKLNPRLRLATITATLMDMVLLLSPVLLLATPGALLLTLIEALKDLKPETNTASTP